MENKLLKMHPGVCLYLWRREGKAWSGNFLTLANPRTQSRGQSTPSCPEGAEPIRLIREALGYPHNTQDKGNPKLGRRERPEAQGGLKRVV